MTNTHQSQKFESNNLDLWAITSKQEGAIGDIETLLNTIDMLLCDMNGRGDVESTKEAAFLLIEITRDKTRTLALANADTYTLARAIKKTTDTTIKKAA